MDFSSRRLAYEPLVSGHAAGLLVALGDPRVSEHFTQPEPSSMGPMLSQLRLLCAGPPAHRSQESWLNFAVRLPGDRLIGRIEATIAGTSAELAYLFDPSVWGYGFATEAVVWL
ncbi:MAG: GNAT family N-acetyltransferase [Bryobacteraceae bacterium]